jgi:hypothetical protein
MLNQLRTPIVGARTARPPTTNTTKNTNYKSKHKSMFLTAKRKNGKFKEKCKGRILYPPLVISFPILSSAFCIVKGHSITFDKSPVALASKLRS